MILSGRRGFTSLTTDGCMVGGVCEIPKQNNDYCFFWLKAKKKILFLVEHFPNRNMSKTKYFY